jgi:hypothetical protein
MRSVPGGLVRMAVVGAGVAWMAVAPCVAWAQGGARVLGVQVAAGTAPDPLGAQVTSVVAGSLAQRLGVRAGDRLLKIGRVELASRPTDPANAAPPSERLRAAVAEAPEVVPVVVWREGQLLTGVGSWREDFVPVPLHDAESLLRALSELAEPGMVPVQGAGMVPATGGGFSVPIVGNGGAPGTGSGGTVPSTGGAGSVPSFGSAPVPKTGGAGSVPSFGDATVPSFGSVPVPSAGGDGRVPATGGQGRVPSSGGTGSQAAGPDRAWRAACASLQGTRLNATYQWLSRSGASQEQLRFQPDGSYALLRSSAVSSYAEDGCYAIGGGSITFYKALSSALASAPGATSDRRVSLGSASQGAFEPRTVSFAREGNGQGGVVIDGERYWVQR